MRIMRVVISALILSMAFAMGAFTATVYENYQTSKVTPKTDSGFAAEHGWTPMSADPRWSLTDIGTVGTRPFGSSKNTYDVVITRINGQAPYTINGLIAAVDDEYAVDLNAEETAELEANGTVCVYASMVVDLPSTNQSDLEQRMNDCNSTTVVAMTVILSEVL